MKTTRLTKYGPIKSSKKRLQLLIGIAFLFITSQSNAQTCDDTWTGGEGGTVSAGQTICIDGDIASTITVQNGGTVRMCNTIAFSGNMTIQPGGILVLVQGTRVSINGSFTFNGNNMLTYDGDGACNAELEFIAGSGVSLSTTSLCNSANVYMPGGWVFAFGAGTRGSAVLASAPAVGGCAVDPCSAPLPVTLSFFDSYEHHGDLMLHWETSMELNSSHFILEESNDLNNWHVLGIISSAGTTNETTSYEVVDHDLYSGINYYRLTQVDFDGTQEVFPIHAYERKEDDQLKLHVVKNPIDTELKIVYSTPTEDNTKVRVVSLQGEVFGEYDVTPSSVHNHFDKELPHIPSGVYFIVLEDANGNVVREKVYKM